ncbi:MAG TPA: hypothetical protein VFV03_07390 [Solirubrobacteraceae bacterium]|nr:hypothetical protein [Solirubrobacteraceae bacterium]
MGSLRLAETTILVLVGVLLAVATVNDVVRQTHVNHRLVADLGTWRTITGHDYRNLKVEQDLKGHTTRDTVCGNVSPGGPDERTQVCLTFVGPVLSGRRAVSGGYYLPAQTVDERSSRYACFGAPAQAGLCGRAAPPAGAALAPPLPAGRP